MIIRPELPTDYDSVYYVVKKAFATAEHSDGNEQDLVNVLRKSTAFIPELSLIAEENNKIIGHIMLTKLLIENHIILALAPLSVLPEKQYQGVSSALIAETHKRAKSLGYNYSVVLGSEKYYPKFGYLPAKNFNIKPPFEVPQENFMALKLRDDAPKIAGIVKYAKEFGI
ncbi:N-acetyltransferase [uncultured Phascolarctobacterium sp.]|uniref:GNAT family N-acetyltransferase n=1 Tax=uncultured Phascolarctobacterium sp. TaxID=512296 RepID=UPI00260AC092|nr:N-acetyltransferase [uncultured Phascolarctobacterium sp.]